MADKVIVTKSKLTAVANSIRDRTGTTDSLTLDEMPKAINDISNNSSKDTEYLKGLIQRDITSLVIPNGTTEIGGELCNGCRNLTSVVIPDSVTSIGYEAFLNCPIINLDIPYGVTHIYSRAFNSCTKLEALILPDSIQMMYSTSFGGCTNLTNLIIGNLKSMSPDVFQGCKNLENVTIADGFNGSGLNLSASALYSVDTIVSWLKSLADRTNEFPYTLTIGNENLAKLTDEQKAIATNKNWNLA